MPSGLTIQTCINGSQETENLLKKEAQVTEAEVKTEQASSSESDVSQALAAYKRWVK